MRTFAILTTIAALSFPAATQASQDRADKMTWKQLARAAKTEVRRGGIYSTRWGDASPWLKRLSAELVERGFQPYGTQKWAAYIVNRESGYNPGAVNRTSGCAGLPQIHPMHTWVDFKKLKSDPAYAVRVFIRMSRGGANTAPWRL